MSGVPVGSEGAAVQVLTRAIQLDNEKKFAEALACYEQGIRLLLQAAKETKDETKRTHFRKKMEDYLGRAEAMKEAAAKQKTLGQTHKQIQIEAGSIGYGYDTVFGPLVDKSLSAVVVEDAYIRATHQIYNFLQFCEFLVRQAECLRSITLLTTRDPADHSTQRARLEELRVSLASYKVTLTVKYSNTIHDREIKFDSGWIIKIGRGLDYFCKPSGSFSLGWTDHHFRPCRQTTIDIFNQQSLQ